MKLGGLKNDSLIFLLILTILVFVHEFGHLLLLKMGVKVEEFGIGLPPRLFGIKKGETLYSLNLLPLGGFVKLYGEEEHNKLDKMDKKELSSIKQPGKKL